MTAEGAYAVAIMAGAGAGLVAALMTMQARAVALALLALLVAVIATALLPDQPRGMAVMILVPLTTALAFLQLGLSCARHRTARTRLATLAALAVAALLGFGLMAVFPGSGFMANLGYVVAIWGFAIPAAAGFALGLGLAALIRRA